MDYIFRYEMVGIIVRTNNFQVIGVDRNGVIDMINVRFPNLRWIERDIRFLSIDTNSTQKDFSAPALENF